MSKESLLIYKAAGISEESDWAQGTITAADKLAPLRDAGIVVGIAPNLIQPARLGLSRASLRDTVLGTISPAFTMPLFGYPAGSGLKTLKAGLGQSSSVETASFTVQTGVNDKINFTEDGGAERTATLTAGTYIMGTTSATASTLCKEVKDRLEDAPSSAGTYTVTFSTTTKKMTIAVSGGATVFVLKFSTGANAALSARTLLGYGAVDTVSGASAVAGTAVEIVFTHTISILEAITYGLSKGLTTQVKLADSTLYDLLDCVVNALQIRYAPNQELHWDAELHARKFATSAATFSGLAEPTMSPLVYSGATFTLNSVSMDLSGMNIGFSNNYKTDLFINSQYRSKFVRGGLRSVTGTFMFDITDVRTYDVFDDFIADSAGVPMVATFTGALIKTGHNYTMTFTLPLVKFNMEALPGGGGLDAPPGEVGFIALDDKTNGEMYITVKNNEATI